MNSGYNQSLPQMDDLRRMKRTPLPPIICERDKVALTEVQEYIECELTKVRCSTPGVDNKKFAIYSTAFSMLISKVKVYQDILSDIKREYDICIGTLKDGEREAKFLQTKVKTLSSIPTTVSGYERRREELKVRLSSLHSEIEKLEEILNNLVKEREKLDQDGNCDELEEEENVASDQPEKIELRPIPGMPVSEWIDEESLKYTLGKLKNTLEDLKDQKETSYVPNEKQEAITQEFKEKHDEKERLDDECQILKKRHKILKMATEMAREYKEFEIHRTGESLADYICKKVTDYSIKRESSHLVDSPYSAFEDDDPSKEKEAEMILDYIEKFNELFFDGQYGDAATHAAISPRGVLRDMETLLRFKEVSEDYKGTPTPLLMFAEAFMYSSSAQNNYADEKISYEFVNCALKQDRPDMVLHWMTHGYIKTCKKVADCLVEFAVSSKKKKIACLAAAQKMYAEIDGCKVISAALLYKLGQPARMLEFTQAEKFTRETYFKLIQESMDGDLIWLLANTKFEAYQNENNGENFPAYQSSLPLPLSHALVSMLDVGDQAKEVVVNLLEEIYHGQKSEEIRVEDEKDDRFIASDLSKIIYNDGQFLYDNDDFVKQRWKALAKECEEHNKVDLAMEIHAALVVRKTIKKALILIAEDEKEQFDYYT